MSVAIPAGLIGPNGFIDVEAQYTMTANANYKYGIIKLGGSGGTAHFSVNIGAGSATHARAQRRISNRNSASSQLSWGGGGTANSFTAGTGTGNATSAINTAADTTLWLGYLLQVGTDVITLEQYTVTYFKG